MTLLAAAVRAEDPAKLTPGTVLPVRPVPDVPGVIAFVSPVGPTVILVPPGGEAVNVFPRLVTMVCPLPNVPMDCVPGIGFVSAVLFVGVPGTVPPVPDVPGVTAILSPVWP
jgi:hypothetical protein